MDHPVVYVSKLFIALYILIFTQTFAYRERVPNYTILYDKEKLTNSLMSNFQLLLILADPSIQINPVSSSSKPWVNFAGKSFPLQPHIAQNTYTHPRSLKTYSHIRSTQRGCNTFCIGSLYTICEYLLVLATVTTRHVFLDPGSRVTRRKIEQYTQ